MHTVKARPMSKPHRRRGFTLIELVVVITILAILTGVLVPRVNLHMKSARDARRLADIKSLRNAIEQYYMDRGEYPRHEANSAFGEWDVSHDGAFLRDLVEQGYLEEELLDPQNDPQFHYRYVVLPPGSWGCQGKNPFYVLGVRNFENAEFAQKHKSFFKCSNRNWSNEFAYVTGGGVVQE